jgi:hypothetical protein
MEKVSVTRAVGAVVGWAGVGSVAAQRERRRRVVRRRRWVMAFLLPVRAGARGLFVR